jgi:hypothetical protein
MQNGKLIKYYERKRSNITFVEYLMILRVPLVAFAIIFILSNEWLGNYYFIRLIMYALIWLYTLYKWIFYIKTVLNTKIEIYENKFDIKIWNEYYSILYKNIKSLTYDLEKSKWRIVWTKIIIDSDAIDETLIITLDWSKKTQNFVKNIISQYEKSKK